ncbi:hypothetical protein NY78_1399 [Desulfovibrio sp. TomC]|nr:hypothetical protein NY78_1399 [Desulfovibrio sp. TomC]
MRQRCGIACRSRSPAGRFFWLPPAKPDRVEGPPWPRRI